MKYDEKAVEKVYQENLIAAHKLLASLPIAEGREPNTKGLTGWIYEQTIRYCLFQELMILGLFPIMKEQVPLYGRTKIDLLVGRVAVEIKARGSFGKDDATKYGGYRDKVEERGWVYLYLTGSETYEPYRLATTSVFGKDHAFFLDRERDWKRFVTEVARNIGESPNHSLQPTA